MTPTIEVQDNLLTVRTRYDRNLVAEMARIHPESFFDYDKRAWIYPATPEIACRVQNLLGLPADSLPPELRSKHVETTTVDESRLESLRAAWPGSSKPYRHQLVGLALLLDNKEYALFWEMGCGKSAPVAVRIAIGLGAQAWSRVLIVCPKSALQVWPHELERHGGIDRRKVEIVRGPKDLRQVAYRSKASVLVINYEVARMDRDIISKLCWCDCVVLDESHRIKTLNAATSKAVRKISRTASCRIALTGTPAPNSPIDVCGTLAFLNARILGTESITAIRRRYCVMGGFNQYQVVGYRALDDLERRTASVSQRLRKDDCLDLPPKIFEERTVELSREQKRLYRELKDDAVTRIESARGNGLLTVANILTESMRLLQVVGGFLPDDTGKLHPLGINPKLDTLKDILEDLGDGQAIIWANFVAEVHAIASEIDGKQAYTPEGRCAVHHGSLSTKERESAIESFKSGHYQFLVSTPQSAREALTLTNASTVIYYSRGWNLLDWSQSQDRAHRIGQTRPVTIVSLVARGTVDERIGLALEKKQSLQELIVGGGPLL